MRITVDLDAEKGRTREPPQPIYCIIRHAKVVRMAVLEAYLTKKIPFDTSILEAISKFLNCVMK